MGQHPAYLPVFLWSLVILASFWGWGEALRRLLNRKEFSNLGWGLTMAWGMAVTLALGGLLMAFSLAKAPMLTALVLAGALFATVFAFMRLTSDAPVKTPQKSNPTKAPGPSHATTPGDSFLLSLKLLTLALLWAIAALAFASSIAWPLQIDPNDDVVCYLFFPEKILQTGSLIEPFNVRRMGTFGGQSLLQALVMIVGGERNGHVPDRGFGMLMIFGMLLHLTRSMPSRAVLFRFLTVGTIFFVSVPRINTGSSLTGAAVLLGILVTMARVLTTPEPAWKKLAPAALLIAAAGALRPTYLVCGAGIAAIALAPPLLSSLWRRSDFRPFALSWANRTAILGGMSLLFLTPWITVLWQSNHTPIYPPFMGTMNPEFAILGSKAGPLQDAAHAFAYFFTAEALVLIACLSLAWFVQPRGLSLAAVAAAVGISWITSFKFGVTILSESYRYTFPMLFPVAAWLLASCLKDWAGRLESTYKRYPAMIALGLLLALGLPRGGAELVAMTETLPEQTASTRRLVNPILTTGVSTLQQKAEPGATIFAAIDTPYALDFARNRVFTADVAGASAIGRWPLEKGPEALKCYLLDHGVRYLMVTDFNNAMLLYTRRHWREHHRPEWFFKEVWGRYMLDFMDSADSLALSEKLVGTAANLRLIDLEPQQ